MNGSERQPIDATSPLVLVPIADVLACASDSRDKPRKPMKNALVHVGVEQRASQLTATASICFSGPHVHEKWTGLRILIAVGTSCTGVPLREVLSAAVDQMPSLEYAARFTGVEQSDLLPIEIHLYRRPSEEISEASPPAMLDVIEHPPCNGGAA